MKLKDAERGRDVEDRLHANKSALASKVSKVPEGEDNRWNILHQARFLGGAVCSAQMLWSTARAVIGINGHPPPEQLRPYSRRARRFCHLSRLARAWESRLHQDLVETIQHQQLRSKSVRQSF